MQCYDSMSKVSLSSTVLSLSQMVIGGKVYPTGKVYIFKFQTFFGEEYLVFKSSKIVKMTSHSPTELLLIRISLLSNFFTNIKLNSIHSNLYRIQSFDNQTNLASQRQKEALETHKSIMETQTNAWKETMMDANKRKYKYMKQQDVEATNRVRDNNMRIIALSNNEVRIVEERNKDKDKERQHQLAKHTKGNDS